MGPHRAPGDLGDEEDRPSAGLGAFQGWQPLEVSGTMPSSILEISYWLIYFKVCLYICLFPLCVRALLYACGSQRTTFRRQFSLLPCGSWGRTQVVRLGSSCLYPVSLLIDIILFTDL